MTYLERPWLKNYDSNVPAQMEIPEVSLAEYFNETFPAVSQNPAVRFLGVTLSYQDLAEYSDRFAQALIRNGCGPGDVVGINLPNVPQYLVAQLGAMKAGCAVSGVSPLLTPRELAYQINDSGAKALVTLDAIFDQRLAGISDNLPGLKLVVATKILDFLPSYKQLLAKWLKKVPRGNVRPLPGKQVIEFTDVLKNYPADRPSLKVSPDDNCLIQYTGGTTGLPKGAVITHRNFVSQLNIVVNWLQMRPSQEVILSAFPLFHIAGLALAMGSLFQGSVQILIPDPRNTQFIVKEMKKYSPTILVNVPSLYMMLLEQPGFRNLDFSRLTFCLSAASPYPAEAIKDLESVVGAGKLVEAYGMTECSALATCNPRLGKKKIASVGLPLSNTRVRLMDLETGTRDVPFGEEGEILISGPQVMQGYLNKPSDTENSLRDHSGETWLHTGDVGRMDEDGYITIVDRTKDMLNVGGFKVFSREVEEKLYEHPAIEFCAVIGVPNPKRPGTEIVKLVFQPSQAVKNRDVEELKAEITSYARENCAPYKVPKIIEVVDAIPLTAVGKVDKKALR